MFMKEKTHRLSRSFKPKMIKLSRHHHHSHHIQDKTPHTNVIHVTIRSRSKSISSSQYDLHSIPTASTKHHHQNRSNESSVIQTKKRTYPANVTNIHSSQPSSSHSSENSWHNDDIKKKLTKINKDQMYENRNPKSKISSEVTMHSIELNSAVKTKNGYPDWTTFENEHHREKKKKKKTKYLRACIITSIIIAVLLAITITVILVVLLNKSKPRIIDKVAVLRWNATGITVAGVTNQPGDASNKLNIPLGLAFDYSNSLYIADYYNNRVQKYTAGASFGITVAGQANGTGCTLSVCLSNPSDVAVDTNRNLYVTDTSNSRVQFWPTGSSSGTTVAGNSSSSNLNDQLISPFGISHDSDSDAIYVAETSSPRVMRYLPGSMAGTIVAGSGILGPNITQLSILYGIYFDLPTNSLLIANTGRNNIVRWVIGASSWTLVAGDSNGLFGSSSAEFGAPTDVISDPMGNIYVADGDNHRIQFFAVGQSNGITIAGVNSTYGIAADLLNTPYSIALDSQLNLYVSDTSNHRVQKFLRY